MKQFQRSRHDRFGSDKAQTVVMPLGTDVLVAILARHLVVEHAAGNGLGGVLWIGQGVQIHDRGADRRCDMYRAGVVADQK